jgi:hypothetical protein
MTRVRSNRGLQGNMGEHVKWQAKFVETLGYWEVYARY